MKHVPGFLFISIFMFSTTTWGDMHNGGSMHDKHTESKMMSTQQATQQMMHHNMSQKSVKNMMQMMDQMQQNLSQMSRLMENNQMMNQQHLTEAAKLMQHMSASMHDMSQKMEQGQFDDETLAAMNERHKEMTTMMENLQKQLQEQK